MFWQSPLIPFVVSLANHERNQPTSINLPV